MKRGSRKAIERALKMADYLDANEDRRMTTDIRIDSGSVFVNGYFKTHRDVAIFKREFSVGRLNKSTFGETMDYDTTERFVKSTLNITLSVQGKLPPSCAIVEKEVWVNERVVKGHYETKREIVCDKPSEIETEKEEATV